MESTFPAQVVIPGTFIRVQADALITAGGISTGNIGIVGTASQGLGETHLFSDYRTATETVGPYDATHHLTRGLELLFRAGARTVYARGLDPAAAAQNDFATAFDQLVLDDVNILVAPELGTDTALAVLGPVLTTGETNSQDMIAVIGSDEDTTAGITGQVPDNGRIVFAAPGVRAFDSDQGAETDLSGTFTAAPVAGLLSGLAPQSSPTNKVIPGITRLAERFSYGQNVDLVSSRVLTLEERSGVRVIRGLTSNDGPFAQITTRRITDFAKAGMRSVGNPFLGRLNNERVRGALKGALAGFLDSMVENEMLISYLLEVTATRQDEIAGRVTVNAVLRPTFSIDFIMVTLVLE